MDGGMNEWKKISFNSWFFYGNSREKIRRIISVSL